MVLIQAGIIGIMTNCTGVLFSAIIKDQGFRAGDLSIYFFIRSMTSAVTVGTISKLFLKRGKIVVAALAAITAAGLACMSQFSQLWQWYIAAVATGIGLGVIVIQPFVLNSWFNEHNGLVIGIGMSASGVAGAVYSPICARFIETFGWRMSTVLTGAIGGCLALFGALVLLIPSPEAVGDEPLGGHRTAEDVRIGKAAPAPAKWVFPVCVLALVGGGCLTNFNNQLSIFANSLGYAATVGAMLNSMSMTGNVVGKLTMGALTDKIGIYRSMLTFLGAVVLSMVLFLVGGGSQMTLYAAALIYGLVYSLPTTSISLLALDVYGKESYKPWASRLQALNQVAPAIFGVVFPYIYDLTGSFNLVFIFGMFSCGMSILATLRLKARAKAVREQQAA